MRSLSYELSTGYIYKCTNAEQDKTGVWNVLASTFNLVLKISVRLCLGILTLNLFALHVHSHSSDSGDDDNDDDNDDDDDDDNGNDDKVRYRPLLVVACAYLCTLRTHIVCYA